MKPLFLFLLTILSLTASAQKTTTLPNWLVDSLLFEAKYSRQCSVALDSTITALEKQGQELLSTDKALKLSQSEATTLQGLVDNAVKDKEADKKQFDIDKDKLKKKIKKRNLVIVGEGFCIFILILLI